MTKNDLISRAKMKEALYEIVSESTPHLLLSKDPNNGKIYATDVLRAIDHLPSETSQNLSKPNNTCEVDLISRADAIEAVKDTMKRLVDDEPRGDSDTLRFSPRHFCSYGRRREDGEV